MKHKRYIEEQIIGILKEHEAGLSAQEVIRKHGIATGTFYRWKNQFGGMEVSEAKPFTRAGKRKQPTEKTIG